MMRHFGPPHAPDLIPSMEPEMPQHRQPSCLDDVKGKTRIDVVDEFAYPVPVTVICKILGVPLEDDPQLPRLDRGRTWTGSTSARRRVSQSRAGAAVSGGSRAVAEFAAVTWPS